MLRSLRYRSRVFRSLLVLALLAWTAFAFEAMAHPLAMSASMANMAGSTTGQTMSSHCKGIPSSGATSTTSTPAPSQPIQDGHGCCAFGHCDCASFCGSIVGVPSVVMTWPPLRDPALVPIHTNVLPVTVPPHLRPPIV